MSELSSLCRDRSLQSQDNAAYFWLAGPLPTTSLRLPLLTFSLFGCLSLTTLECLV